MSCGMEGVEKIFVCALDDSSLPVSHRYHTVHKCKVGLTVRKGNSKRVPFGSQGNSKRVPFGSHAFSS